MATWFAVCPAVGAGARFFDRAEVREVLAYLQLLVNPRDEIALLRVIDTPPRGLSAGKVGKLNEAAVAGGQALWDLLPEAGSHVRRTATGREGIEQLRELVDRHRGALARGEPPVTVFRRLLDEVAYRDELARRYPNADELQNRWASVEEVVNALASHGREGGGEAGLDGFLRRRC